MVKKGPGKFKERVVAEAGKQGVEVGKPESISMEDQEAAAKEAGLFAGNEAEAPPPITVRDGHMMANYVRPHYDTDDDVEGGRVVGMEFSFPLTDDHRGKLPRHVTRAWKFLQETREKCVKLSTDNIKPQAVYIRLDPKDRKALLHLTEAKVRNAVLTQVEEKGSGKSKDVIRYSFQVVASVCKEVCEFADYQYGNMLWLDISDAQGELHDKD